MGCTTPVGSNSNSIHMLMNFKGNVQVKKTQWRKLHQDDYGSPLNSNDQIKLERNASVTIYCSNGDPLTETQPGTHLLSEICRAGEAVIRLCPDCNNDTRRPIVTKEQ
ncbi:MAG: hypothetical protein F6K53_43020, partial [Moorea sp. SIO4A1]|uniref:hypothetical protein n=1 Tax=Moorena sp. SIO4A1 TaxID=2607835 RepID=UPI00145087AE